MMPHTDKAVATLQAEFARLGWGLIAVRNAGGEVELIAHKWTSSRLLPDLAAAEMLLALLQGHRRGGPPA